MFTQGLRKPLFLPRELEPQVSSSTCGFGFIGVACSERVSLSGNRKRNENIDVSRVFGLRDEVQDTLPAAVFIQNFCSHSEFSVTVFQVVAFHSSDANIRKSWQRWIVSGRSSVRKARFFQREFKAQVLSATCGVGFVRGVCSHKGCENHYFYRGNWNRRCQAQRVALGSSV